MNTTFNFSRFLKVLSNEWSLNLKKILLFWSAIIIMTVIYFAIFRYGYGTPRVMPKFMTFSLLFFFACLLQGFYLQFYFHEFSSKNKTQALLLLPASRNETFWAKSLLGVVPYVIIFSTFIFIALKWNGIQNDWAREFNLNEYEYYQDHLEMNMDLTTKFILSLVWLFLISIYLFGITLFKKQPVLKTWGLWFIIGISSSLITRVVFLLFTGTWASKANFGGEISIKSGYEHQNYECNISEIYPEFTFGFIIFICLALIFISRVKYNEKTI